MSKTKDKTKVLKMTERERERERERTHLTFRGKATQMAGDFSDATRGWREAV